MWYFLNGSIGIAYQERLLFTSSHRRNINKLAESRADNSARQTSKQT